MTILEKLASNLGRRDERPNVALAEILVASGDQIAIAELAKALAGGTIAVRGDAIKVLYEIGERSPALIAPHTDVFFTTLKSNNNRLHWGALSALATLAASQPQNSSQTSSRSFSCVFCCFRHRQRQNCIDTLRTGD